MKQLVSHTKTTCFTPQKITNSKMIYYLSLDNEPFYTVTLTFLQESN